MREEGLIKGWGIGVNTPEPIVRLLEVADPDVCLLASQYSLIDHKNALDQVFPAARAKNVSFVIEEFLLRLASDVLQQDFLELQPTYLVRDLLIEELARSLYLESENRPLNAEVASAAVKTLCVRLLRAYSVRRNEEAYATGGLGPARECRVREYIEAHLERDLSIQSLAGVVGLSPQHFAILFRESTGFTPHQYVNHRRIACAQELLKKADIPLIEVSMQCGFSSQSQFITTFRKLVGMTPGRFRSSLTSSQS
jgi:AraC family transcriptional regulator